MDKKTTIQFIVFACLVMFSVFIPIVNAVIAYPHAKADLIPFLMWASQTVNATTTSYHFFATIKNKGRLLSGVTKTRLRVDIRKNGTWDFESFRTTGGLIPGGLEGELWASAITLPNASPHGIHLFQMCVDSLDSEVESDESNNCRRMIF